MNLQFQLLERSVAPGAGRGDPDHDLGIQRDWVFEQIGDGQSGHAASPADTEALSPYLDEREMEIPQRI